MTPIHLRTFAAGAAFTLLCVAGSTFAAKTPPATHGIGTAAVSELPASSGPSTSDKLAALTKRVDQLQRNAAQDHRTLIATGKELDWSDTRVDDALSVTDCINGAVWVVQEADETGDHLTPADASTENAFAVATLDPACLNEDSP